jgi:hypothetical protein
MNPTDHDAPLLRLLSIKHNPLVAEMTREQLTDLVQRLRHKPGRTLKPTPKSNKAAYQALLDTL